MKPKKPSQFQLSLEYQLCEILMSRAGERGYDEDAIDCLCRIIRERDQALTLIALDKLNSVREGNFVGQGGDDRGAKTKMQKEA